MDTSMPDVQFGLIFIGYGQLLIHLPSPSFATDNENFNKIISVNIFIIIGSFSSYIVSEPLNSYIIAKMKKKNNGQYIAIRFLFSTIIASFIDSIIFATIAFFNIYSINDIVKIVIDIWVTKTIIEIIGLPLSIRLTKALKKSERLDIYDEDTDFTPLSLEAEYTSINNKYKNGDI